MPLLRFSLLLLLLTPASLAQRSKYTSPAAETSVAIRGKKITVEYYSPSMHGRKVMGGLVPYGQVWCTGANWATKLTTEADLEIGGLKLPTGSYSIWTVPNEREWTLIINRETGQFHLNYDPSRDLGRTRMTLASVPGPIEAFRIELRRAAANTGKLVLMWENTEAFVDFALH